ncbi:Vacuolar membrane protease [Alteripontixanthobacter maritimus]|uniref:Vacuolar membrane protease n=1 Tax=Alteripontixanthobacter maritimus TaxID=2161824 RepID=A0A369Q9D1_9SPHN|nr:M20/M25/M40 family metallo-hydrolase [Alteripontixanthobacter maritimus]RDC59867.1 Vacuolar membrane protease [Alteripontixanthobacter maritimus]
MRNFIWLAGILVAAMVLAIFATTPPAPIGSDAPETEFSAGRAMEDIRVVAAAPRPTGSAANARALDYLSARMEALGMDVSTQEQPLPDRAAGGLLQNLDVVGEPRPTGDLTMTNLTGILRGTDPSLPAIMLMSHHDTVVASPGASDDTTGVAVSLEVVRALRAAGPQRRDVVVLMTDAEELGLNGARYFFEEDPLRSRIGAIINMEARGAGGRTSLFQTSAQNGEAVQLFADSVSRPAGTSLSVLVYLLLPNNTDLTPALTGDYTAYNFAFIGRPGLYHSPMATPENLDQGSVQDMGAQVLALTAALADTAELPGKAPDVAFFDVFGLFTLVFAPWWGWLFLVVGVAGIASASSASFDVRQFFAGAWRAAGLLLLLVFTMWVLNMLTGPGSGEFAYYDRLAAIPRMEWMALMGSLAAVVMVLRNADKGPSGFAGFALVPAALGLGLQAMYPSAAYVVTIPIMFAGIAVAAIQFGRSAGRIVAAVLAAVVVGYNISLAHQIMQGVGPDLPMAVVLPVLMAVMLLIQFWPKLPGRTTWLMAGGLLLAAVAIALWIRFDAPAETVANYAVSEDSKSK